MWDLNRIKFVADAVLVLEFNDCSSIEHFTRHISKLAHLPASLGFAAQAGLAPVSLRDFWTWMYRNVHTSLVTHLKHEKKAKWHQSNSQMSLLVKTKTSIDNGVKLKLFLHPAPPIPIYF